MTTRQAPLSILHITSPGEVGGLERVVHALAGGQHRAGHRVRVAAILNPSPHEHPFVIPLEQAGVEVVRVQLDFRAYRAERRAIRELCLRDRPDVIHTHGYRTDVLEVGVARSLGIPVITTLHGSSSMGGITAAYDVAQFLSLWRFDAVVAVSRRLASTLGRWGVRKERLHVIPNGWTGQTSPLTRAEARQAIGAPREGQVVGFVGRLIKIKGCDLFLRAIADCRDLPIHAVIVGDGPERPGLEALTKSLDLTGRVTFSGAHDHAAEIFPAFDLWVMSSRSEGIPIALFEAIAAGVPVVATAVGGVPEVVSSEHAILVPPEDPVGLGRAIRMAVEAPAAALGRAAAARIRLTEEFGAERWLQRYEAVYRGVVKNAEATS